MYGVSATSDGTHGNWNFINSKLRQYMQWSSGYKIDKHVTWRHKHIKLSVLSLATEVLRSSLFDARIYVPQSDTRIILMISTELIVGANECRPLYTTLFNNELYMWAMWMMSIPFYRSNHSSERVITVHSKSCEWLPDIASHLRRTTDLCNKPLWSVPS